MMKAANPARDPELKIHDPLGAQIPSIPFRPILLRYCGSGVLDRGMFTFHQERRERSRDGSE